jgi:hypothetical protein
VDAAATPFVQGKLRNEELSFEIRTECACCSRHIELTMKQDLSYTLHQPESSPVFFMPLVDFTTLKAPSIVDDF